MDPDDDDSNINTNTVSQPHPLLPAKPNSPAAKYYSSRAIRREFNVALNFPPRSMNGAYTGIIYYQFPSIDGYFTENESHRGDAWSYERSIGWTPHRDRRA
ncbi:hypothetical protein MW887_006537 [Aspergillus wentii]|nr:hypothetical protein MW887_006537 [Aspergillus wentii]